ncbi:hypothetical protein [Pontibacillus marinus]|uniref:Uncharacterized protein n=1 Tax=Pontibacillus marinus BH030004 = DSM 16465 TaxID=1385511 RepID=A0A0A5GIJ2_9BACI|nr:hypothetical protein [Pontibacillus marinus]KGX91013.1 hypothetical protein N783_13235 [Pontibacillus marinus BH030004 = DSM 16465]
MKKLMVMGMTSLMALVLLIGGFNVMDVQAEEGPQFQDPVEPPIKVYSDPVEPPIKVIMQYDPVEPPIKVIMQNDPVEPPIK